MFCKSTMESRAAKMMMLFVIVASLAACEANPFQTAKRNVAENLRQAEAARQVMSNPIGIRTDGVQFVNDVFIGDKVVPMYNGEPLPREFDKSVSIGDPSPMTLGQVAQAITAASGLLVELETPTAGTVHIQQVDPARAYDPRKLPPLTGIPSGPVIGGREATPAAGLTSVIEFEGPLRDLLDLVANRYNVAWEYRNGVVRFQTRITRTFSVFALTGTQTVNALNSSGGKSLSGNSGGAQNATTEAVTNQSVKLDSGAINTWNGVLDTIKAIVSQDGSVTPAPGTGTVTVTARPNVITQVKDYIDGQNALVSRQVSVNIRIFAVNYSGNDELSMQIGGALNRAGGPNIAFNPATTGFDPSSGSLALTATGGIFKNSSLVLRALSSVGRSTLVNTTNVIAVNGEYTPISNVEEITYLASTTPATSTATTSSGTPGLTPGVITIGLSGFVVPRILEDGRVFLQINMSLSELVGEIQSITSNGQTIQIPRKSTRAIPIKTTLQSGQTMINAGYERISDQINRVGTGNPDFPLLGGLRGASSERSSLVVMITPIVLDMARNAEPGRFKAELDKKPAGK